MSYSQSSTYGDKEFATDLLYSEKHLASQYCSFLSEAATPEVIRTLSSLLSDTHDAQQSLFTDMNSRGWYPVSKAEEQKVTQAKQKFGSMVTQ